MRKNSLMCEVHDEAQTAAENQFNPQGAGGGKEMVIQAYYKPLSGK